MKLVVRTLGNIDSRFSLDSYKHRVYFDLSHTNLNFEVYIFRAISVKLRPPC